MKMWRRYRLSILSFLGSLLVWITTAAPSYSHWADLSVAEIVVSETQTQITLTFPTGLVASADDNRDGQLSPNEVRTHRAALHGYLEDHLRLTDDKGTRGTLTLKPLETANLPPNLKATTGTHSTLLLIYTWPESVQGLKIYYNLFLPGVPTASCLATILESGQVQSFAFRPDNREFSLMPGSQWLAGSLPLAIAGAFVWGAMHTMSPGHGKTVIGAYLVGAHATPKHALFLGLITTVTHTAGVFALGLVTLFVSNYILPEQLYPWLSFLSGLMILAIGLNLFIRRMRHGQRLKKLLIGHHPPNHPSEDHSHHHGHNHSYSHRSSSHTHSHSHDHLHDHYHDHSRGHGSHSHLPPGANGSPVTWYGLLALGISGGLIPCPAALVVLLSATSLGHVGFGLVLVLAFSLGLAGVLTGLGLLLVYAKQLFERVPTNIGLTRLFPAMRVLPTASALLIVMIGLGITLQALMQAELVRL